MPSQPALQAGCRGDDWCLAVLQGEQWAGSVDDHLWRRIAQRFAREGLLDETWEDRDVRQALHDMNQRLRYATRACADVHFVS